MKKERLFEEGSYQVISYRLWYKPSGYKGREKECQVEMVVDHGYLIHTITNALWCLLSVCEELAPAQYAYIESVLDHVNMLNADDEALVRVLEDEGFDFHWLIKLYLEQLRPKDIVDGPAPNQQPSPFQPSLTEHINLGDGLCDDYKKDAEQILYKRLAKLHELDQEEQIKFDNLLFEHAYAVGKNSANLVWLAEGYDEPNEEQQEALKQFEPEGRRKEMETHLHEYGRNNPPFTTEILDWEDWWPVVGSNEAHIYVRFTTDEGEGYGHIGFSDLRTEAYLRFPDLYRRIEELEAEQPHYLKKEQPVLASLLAEGCDLQAVAHSYAMRYIDVKGPVIWERVAQETGSDRGGEYGEYLTRQQSPAPPSDRIKWLQICTNLHTEVADAWMAILLRECEVLFSEKTDYRLRDWAVYEVMANASNFFSYFRDEMEFLDAGGRLEG